jgi:hypothetical protein
MILSLRGLGSSTYNDQILTALPTYCPSCPPQLVLSLVQAESSGNMFTNSGAIVASSQGAEGLFQLLPSTAAGLNVDPTTVAGNIQGGETYLQQLYNQFGSWDLALMAYNEGPNALQSQLNAGATPTSTGYAQGILTNAGLTASGTSVTAPSDDGDEADGDTSEDVLGSIPTYAWVGLAAVAGLMLWSRRN